MAKPKNSAIETPPIHGTHSNQAKQSLIKQEQDVLQVKTPSMLKFDPASFATQERRRVSPLTEDEIRHLVPDVELPFFFDERNNVTLSSEEESSSFNLLEWNLPFHERDFESDHRVKEALFSEEIDFSYFSESFQDETFQDAILSQLASLQHLIIQKRGEKKGKSVPESELLEVLEKFILERTTEVIDDDTSQLANDDDLSNREETAEMNIREKLQIFSSLEDFAGVEIFTPTGEVLAKLPSPSNPFMLDKIGILANNVLLNAQKATKELGDGVAQLITINAERAQILVYCFNEGSNPLLSENKKVHIHLVLVLKSDISLGLAKMKIPSVMRSLANDFRI